MKGPWRQRSRRLRHRTAVGWRASNAWTLAKTLLHPSRARTRADLRVLMSHLLRRLFVYVCLSGIDPTTTVRVGLQRRRPLHYLPRTFVNPWMADQRYPGILFVAKTTSTELIKKGGIPVLRSISTQIFPSSSVVKEILKFTTLVTSLETWNYPTLHSSDLFQINSYNF